MAALMSCDAPFLHPARILVKAEAPTDSDYNPFGRRRRLFVDDLPRVATFYEAVLGVAPVRAGNERAEFNGPTLQLALQRRPDAVGSDPATAPVPLPPAATGRYHLRVTVEDLARARVAALATGGHIDEPAGAVAEQQPVSLGRDPEGNVIEVWSR